MERPDLLPGTLEMLILQTLTRGHMHGYGIAQNIKLMSDDLLQIEEGSLYPALQRLMVKGYIEARWGKSENNRRARYYRLSPDGRQQLARELAGFERLLQAIRGVLRPA